jgi:hypothetical protein
MNSLLYVFLKDLLKVHHRRKGNYRWELLKGLEGLTLGGRVEKGDALLVTGECFFVCLVLIGQILLVDYVKGSLKE